MYRNRHRTQSGFTLVETVLSIGIIGAGLVGLMFAFDGLSRNALLADQTAIAVNLARDALEEVVARRDCNNAGCGYSATLSAISSGTYDASPVSGFPGFILDTNVAEVNADDDDAIDDFMDASAGSGYARITVTMSWNGGANSISLESLMTNYTEPGP